MSGNRRKKIFNKLAKRLRARMMEAKSDNPKSMRAKNSTLKKNSASRGTKRSPRKKKRILLTTAEAAQMLNLSTRTLDNWRYENKGPKWVKLGRLVRYEKREIVRFIKDGRR